jgi:TRAP-type C4-dicarboxylate transport system permease small subunit
MTRAVGRIMAVPRLVIGVLILFSIALNFANVVGRYVFLSPIIWAEEVMIFLMIWCVFIGAVVVSWDDRHLRMDLLSLHLTSAWRQVVNGTVAALSLGAFALVAAQSWEAVTLFARLGQRSTTAGIPMVIPHSAVLIGFALMFIAVAARFRAIVSGTLQSDVDVVTDAYRDAGASS